MNITTINTTNFTTETLKIFQFQSKHNEIYRSYLSYLNLNPDTIQSINEIPFLPIDFFKTQKVITENVEPEIIFLSSGTTGENTSKHYIKKIQLYEESFTNCFKYFYGNVEEYCILALLPSYLERDGSSLIYMVKKLIEKSKHPHSGFFLNNHDELVSIIYKNEQQKQKTILLGVSFALLDLAEKFSLHLNHTIIMETGGMKGKRKELTRNELHQFLCKKFGVSIIHSEYGMTELLSQAYSKGNGIYNCPPWMKIIIRDINDPFMILPYQKTGGVNVIDLANVYSCAFIETKDLGKLNPDGSFEILGRFDNSDIRGCNLLI